MPDTTLTPPRPSSNPTTPPMRPSNASLSLTRRARRRREGGDTGLVSICADVDASPVPVSEPLTGESRLGPKAVRATAGESGDGALGGRPGDRRRPFSVADPTAGCLFILPAGDSMPTGELGASATSTAAPAPMALFERAIYVVTALMCALLRAPGTAQRIPATRRHTASPTTRHSCWSTADVSVSVRVACCDTPRCDPPRLRC